MAFAPAAEAADRRVSRRLVSVAFGESSPIWC